MRFSKYLSLRLPERLPARNDAADIDDLTHDIEAIDCELELQGQTDIRLEQDKADRTELSEHILKNVLEHPDDCVIDTKIGKRSIGNTKGLLQALLTAIGNMFKAITGEAAWNTTPKTTLAASKTHIDDEIIHIVDTERIKWTDKYTKLEADQKIKTVQDDVNTHEANKANPHFVTATQTGAYTKSEVDNKFSTLETNIDWKEAVASYSDISKIYPSPQDGWTVNVKDTDYTYRYNGSEWVSISANAIPKATADVDGLQTKENVLEVITNTTARHVHFNKNVLETITSLLTQNWNAAYTHISDVLKHIAAEERNLWNSVTSKVDKIKGKQLSAEDYTTAEKKKLNSIADNSNNYTLPLVQTTGTSVSDVMSQKAVTNAISSVGNGDMLKNVYDKNNTGKVDTAQNAEKVNGLNVFTAVPANAKFTDTTYNLVTLIENGLMYAVDKKKLDGVAAGANLYTHPNNGAVGTFSSVTINAQGHVISGTNPTTIEGYGITDVYTKTEVYDLLGEKANTSGTYLNLKAGSAPWSGITDKPMDYPPSSHAHSALSEMLH